MATTFKPPATQRVYDVAILGGGAGGGAAGALLSRRGFRVLQLDTGSVGPRADGGWLFPAGPSLRPAVKSMPSAEALLSELGLASDAARALEPLSPDLQLVFPRARLDLSREATHLAAELRREWGGDATRLGEGLVALAAAASAGGELLKAAPPLPPAGFLDGFALRAALKQAALSAGVEREALAGRAPLDVLAGHPLAAALLALPRFLGHLDGPVSPLAAARLCGMALRGLSRPAAGAPSLEEALGRRLRETRGEVMGSAAEPVRLESLAVDAGRLGALRVAGTPDAYLARVFILAMPLARLLELVPPGGLAARAERELARLRPGRRLSAVHLVIGPAGRPPGLGPAALVASPSGASDDMVLVETGPARRDPRRGHQGPDGGERLVTGWSLSPSSGDGAEARGRIEAAFEETLPFHQRHLLHRFVPEPAPHLVEVDEPALGVAGLPVRSPWKNLLLAGREVVPGLGLEGELYAGLQAAAHAAVQLGAKDRPR